MIEKYPWRTGRSCVFKVYNHLVFVTKYRRGVFTKDILNKLKLIFAETCIKYPHTIGMYFIGGVIGAYLAKRNTWHKNKAANLKSKLTKHVASL